MTIKPAPAKTRLSTAEQALLETGFSVAKPKGAFEPGVIGRGRRLTLLPCPDGHGARALLVAGRRVPAPLRCSSRPANRTFRARPSFSGSEASR